MNTLIELTALDVTLRRYEPENETDPVIGTDHGAFTVAPARTLGELKPSPATGPALAGLLFEGSGDAGFPGEGEGERGDGPEGACGAGDDSAFETEYVPCLAPPFPLTLSVFRDSGGLRLRCDHLGSHVSPEIAARFVRHLAHVHGQVLRFPQTPVDNVELLDEAERARTAALGRPARTVVTTPESIPEAVARTAAATPDRIAVTDGAAGLTHRELEEPAHRLARGLRARGVVVGDRVGVRLERSAQLVVALLAVLRAGATYVPVDGTHRPAPADDERRTSGQRRRR